MLKQNAEAAVKQICKKSRERTPQPFYGAGYIDADSCAPLWVLSAALAASRGFGTCPTADSLRTPDQMVAGFVERMGG